MRRPLASSEGIPAEASSPLKVGMPASSRGTRNLPVGRFFEQSQAVGRFLRTGDTRVSSYATARVKNCAYSVPARLINAHLLARVSETTVSFHHAGIEVARYPRALAQQARIDYRHVIASLVRKPGAFARYLYREELFPRPVFRQAYDQLVAAAPMQADRHYIDFLALAAHTDETLVATVLGALLRAGELPCADVVEKQLHTAPPSAHALAAFVPELHSYDVLGQEVVA